jgi:drug/metabolite transporter (DMT)-like permease
VLWALVARQGLRAGVGSLPMGWMLLLGGLIALQSLCLYSAVARIPVALALLVFNTMPALYTLLTWALGGKRPSGKSLLCMGLILLGLGLALDVLTGLFSTSALRMGAHVGVGVALGFAAASTMACALWITENRLPKVPGAVRSLWAMGLVFVCMLAVSLGGTGLLPGGAAWPRDSIGWAALIALVVLYGSAFSIWFVLMPRLDMARNASFMNRARSRAGAGLAAAGPNLKRLATAGRAGGGHGHCAAGTPAKAAGRLRSLSSRLRASTVGSAHKAYWPWLVSSSLAYAWLNSPSSKIIKGPMLCAQSGLAAASARR